MGLLSRLSDEELLERADHFAKMERESLVELLCCLAEIDSRGSYKAQGHSTSFDLCVRRWRYGRAAAFKRVRAARVINLYPDALTWLRTGELTLGTLSAVQPHLEAKGRDLLYSVVGKSEQEIERLLASVAPSADRPDSIRTLSVAASGRSLIHEDSTAGATPPSAGERLPELLAEPLETSAAQAARVSFAFTGSEELRLLLERAKDLLWHKFPFARLEDVITEAVREFVERRSLELKDSAPRRRVEPSDSRHVPVWTKSLVWKRDGGRCTFVAEDGVRCGATRSLEFDHVTPFSHGGKSVPENLRLLCRAHNQQRGREVMRAWP